MALFRCVNQVAPSATLQIPNVDDNRTSFLEHMRDSALFIDLSSALDRSLPVPLSVQLKGLIEYGIACGELPAGTRLPSVRELAEAGGIAPMTAASVYKELRQAGLIATRAGSGTFVADGVSSASAATVARIEAHLDAAIAEGEAAGLHPQDIASLLSARIGRGRAREARGVRLTMVGVFMDATRAYAAEIARQLKPGDTIVATTIELLRGEGGPPTDVYVTLANRRAEVVALLGAEAVVATISFIPSDRTRARLAGVHPLCRLGLVSVFPEFLALMKPGVLRFAPHVASVEAVVVGDPRIEDLLRRVDVVVHATGAEPALAALPQGVEAIEYRHVPDPLSIQTELLPLVDAVRFRAAPAAAVRRLAR